MSSLHFVVPSVGGNLWSWFLLMQGEQSSTHQPRIVYDLTMGAQTSISLNQVVWVDPERMSGTPCFTGTRVPIQALLDHLEAGDSLDVFLDSFPSVSREQAGAFLELAKDKLLACVSS